LLKGHNKGEKQGHKKGHYRGITRGIVDAKMHRFFTVFLIPLIYKIVFKNASPLGFVIVIIYQKQGSRWVKNLFTPSKNEISPRKNEVHI